MNVFTPVGNLPLRRPAVLAGLVMCLFAILAVAPSAHADSGGLVWQRIFNGSGSAQDMFTGLAPAPKGGVYVVGTTFDANNDIVAARYDVGGQRRWLRTYDGPGDGNDYGSAAATDGHGDLFVAGYVTQPDDSIALAVVKYDSAGHLRWARADGAPAAVVDLPVSLAVDRAGAVYLAGTEIDLNTSQDAFAVTKYSASGTHRWTRRYAQPYGARLLDMAVDGAGDAYATGTSYQGASHGYDVLTLKYDSAGHLRWARLWDGSGFDDAGVAIAVTRAGAAYVGGYTTRSASGQDALLLKYASGGTPRWVRRYTGAGPNPDAYNDVTLLAYGDVAATGSSFSASTLDDVLLARYAPNDSRRWLRLYNGSDNLVDQGVVVAPGPGGAIYVTGDSTGTATGQDILTLKYSGAGAVRWARTHTSAGTAADFATALMVVRGSVYGAGYQAATSGTDGTLLRYRP